MLEIDYKRIDDLYDLNYHDFEIQYVSKDPQLLHELFEARYNISGYNFSFGMCCTDLIRSLFEEFVTRNTIVISSRRDHPSVANCLNAFECKELIYLDDGTYLEAGSGPDTRLFRNSEDFSIRKLADRLAVKDYDNIFFISYGTYVCDGEVRDNKFFEKIFKVCDMHCENTVKVLDDCQGCLWIERDYSIYDYILWTAHATIYMFDAGILLSKQNLPALGMNNVGEEYLYDNYKRLLQCEEFVSSFNKQLSYATGTHLSQAPHIFCLRTAKDYPENYFHDIQHSHPNLSQVVPMKVEARRYLSLRVERFMNNHGKYKLLRALGYAYQEREIFAEDMFLAKPNSE